MATTVERSSVSVIIPARNASATLPATLAGLELQDGEFEVIVVDDGSDDGTRELAASSPRVSTVLERHGGGPGAARNAGAEVARGTALVFLDSDCRPAPGWLDAGIRALEDADLVLGEVRPEPDCELGPYDRTLYVIGLSPLFESANLFVRRELFESLAGFESWLGPHGGKELGEDVWFGWRARRRGARISACPEALVYHAVFPRGALAYADERWRLRFFPELARRIPELREAFFHRRFFLNERSAAFDRALFAAAGVLAAPRRARGPLALGAALAARRYAELVRDDLREGGPELAAARAAADAVGAAAMLYGSLRSRTLLL